MGVNVQAACDAFCRFQFIGVAGPGSMPDSQAVEECGLDELVDGLPDNYVAIADAAYTPTEKMCALFYGTQARQEDKDNFNFYGSQLRIRIEMAFGMMTMKWSLLSAPLRINPDKIKFHITAIARLHNFVINERLKQGKVTFESVSQARSSPRECNPATGTDRRGNQILLDEEGNRLKRGFPGSSAVRDVMVQKVKEAGLKRPLKNKFEVFLVEGPQLFREAGGRILFRVASSLWSY